MLTDSVLRDILKREASWIAGLVVSGMGYGALLTLGAVCLDAIRKSRLAKLRRGRTDGTLQNLFFQAHVLLLLLLNAFLQAWNVFVFIKGIVYTDHNKLTFFYRDWSHIWMVLVVALCDGLLVWRCYMVQKALYRERPAGLHNICWIFPLVLLLLFIGFGVAASWKLDPRTPIWESRLLPGTTLFDISMTIDVVLSCFTTINIIIRLLLHRRSIIAVYGRSSSRARYPLRVSTILLESASLDIPVTIGVSVGVGLKWLYTEAIIRVMVPAQSIASILVIYEVVKGRAINSEVPIDESENESV